MTTQTTGSDVQLLEYASSRGLPLRVDRERGVVQGVKVLGLESRNGRTYRPQALADAAKLYEGKPVNVDHVEGQRRSYRDRIGRLVKIETRGDGLYGELSVNPKHPLAEQLLWDAEHAPENVGLSHDAQGRTSARGGRVIVESIQEVRSVDLVAEPATTRGLFESRDEGATATADSETGDEDAGQDEPVGDVDKLPDSAFALVLPGGVKIGQKTHPLHKRRWPIHNAAAVKRSLPRIQSNRSLAARHRASALQRAVDAARRFGVKEPPTQESCDMKLDDLTLEQIKESRPDLVQALQDATDAQGELVALKEERDQLLAKLAERQRREKIDAELKEAAIDRGKVPASLMEAIEKADDEPRKKLLEDIKGLIRPAAGTTGGTVQSAAPGNPLPASFEDRMALWNR